MLEQEQADRKDEYQKKVEKYGYNVGDYVWLFHHKTYNEDEDNSSNVSRKLLMKWHGPFRIMSRKGVSYTLDITGNDKYRNSRIDCRVHHDRLKIAHSPFEFVHDEDPDESKINDLFSSTFLPENSFVPDDPDEEFEVDSILEHRLIGEFDSRHQNKNEYEYRVRWKGYDPSYDLWLGKEDLKNCRVILRTYLKSDLHNHFQNQIVSRYQ